MQYTNHACRVYSCALYTTCADISILDSFLLSHNVLLPLFCLVHRLMRTKDVRGTTAWYGISCYPILKNKWFLMMDLVKYQPNMLSFMGKPINYLGRKHLQTIHDWMCWCAAWCIIAPFGNRTWFPGTCTIYRWWYSARTAGQFSFSPAQKQSTAADMGLSSYVALSQHGSIHSHGGTY